MQYQKSNKAQFLRATAESFSSSSKVSIFILPIVSSSLGIKKSINMLQKLKLMKPDNPRLTKSWLSPGIPIDPIELTARHMLNPSLRTLLGYTSRV